MIFTFLMIGQENINLL